MSALGWKELQAAIYSELTADATLAALVSGIYDHAPQGAESPYLLINMTESVSEPALNVDISRLDVVLRAHSDVPSRLTVLEIIERAVAVLEASNLALSNHAVIDHWLEGVEAEVHRDVIGYQAECLIRFRIQKQ